MTRRLVAIILLVVAVGIIIAVPLVVFTPVGASILGTDTVDLNGPPLTPVPYTPIPPPKPRPVLTVKGKPAAISASAALLMDSDTGNILFDLHGEQALPMASTTKMMTALIALRSGKLDEMVTVGQDALNEVVNNNGSTAQLVPGDKLTLQDLLYGLLLPSGDDAAVAIADALGGTSQNFVNTMNLYALRLHLFSTHYINPDGLTYYDANHQPLPGHYSTAYDLARLAHYLMAIPLFAKIVQTQTYIVPATNLHHSYKWQTTNDLLPNYKGTTGVKTGHTIEAGYCLVFSATRNGHNLIGVVLNEGSLALRLKDAEGLLNWGFGLPMVVP